MQKNDKSLLTEVADYYSGKLKEHGETAKGVDWNGEESQELRFNQLCKIISKTNEFSINDLGCGYGALFDLLAKRYKTFTYSGTDVSSSMIAAAQGRRINQKNASFTLANQPSEVADFGVASGIFSVRMSRSDEEWKSYIEQTLDAIDQTSRLGFAFNCLTSYSDQEKMRDDLYYANPCYLFDFCKRRYSKDVALLHDYGLYEFTILVRK